MVDRLLGDSSAGEPSTTPLVARTDTSARARSTSARCRPSTSLRRTYRCYLDEMLTEAGVEFDFVGAFTQPAIACTCSTEFDRDHEAVSGATINARAGPALESVELLQPDVALSPWAPTTSSIISRRTRSPTSSHRSSEACGPRTE
jgi:hypothetical protein